MFVKIAYPERRTWLERVSEQIVKENICTIKRRSNRRLEETTQCGA
jgi:hypothetical protein